MITLDWVLNLFFILTVNHFMDQKDISYFSFYKIIPIGTQFLLVSATAIWGIIAVSRQNASLHKWIGILRIVIEVTKLVQCILILNGLNIKL